ncbi:MAG TPA: hypothetical protein VH350_00655 [Candidatus Sulfotelmatobacter sp.]|jgi:hypothetical protein|nr:hypothetical protein [Candidatus Sulfotelmatobacter sp.]
MAMHIHDFAKAYQAKTDEELLQLALDSEHLTIEAHAALTGELAKRRIDTAKGLNVRDQSGRGRIAQPKTRAMSYLPDSHAVGKFVAEVLSIYHGHFWLFIKLIAPAVVAGYVAVLMGRNESREIARHLPRGFDFLGHKTEVFEIWFANGGGYLISWMAFCFSFGAICSAVGQIEVGIAPSIPDSFSAVRERMGSFLRLSLLLLLLFVVGAVAVGLLSSAGLFWMSNYRHFHPSRLAMQAVPFAFVFVFGVLLLLSRLGLAMPAIILDNCRVGQAIFRSDELTEGKWLTLAALLAKSVLGGYVAGMCPFWLASWIPVNIALPSWFPWVLTVVSISAVIVVEPTMFIGLALLYSRMSAVSPASNEALAGQLA